MLFEARNKSANTVTHCGVLEFVAEEGRCYLPHWVRDDANDANSR
jgi:ubiquitin fusion degradation protein 1